MGWHAVLGAIFRLGLPHCVGAVCIGLIWAPFGFRLGPLIEEWDLLQLFQLKGLFFLIDGESLISAQSARPLTVVPQAIAYWLDPNSFAWWHILQICALLLKYEAALVLARLLKFDLVSSISIGLLTLLAPADTMQLNFRSIHINWAIALQLLSAACFCHSFSSKTWPAPWIAMSCMSCACGILMYEPVLMMSAIVPGVLLFTLDRPWIRQVLDQKVRWGAWVLTNSVCAAFVIVMSGRGSSYQAAVVGGGMGQAVLKSVISAKYIITSLLYRSLFECWLSLVDALRAIADFAYLGLACAVVAILLFLARKFDTGVAGPGRPRLIGLATLGLCLSIMAFTPFLVNLTFVSTTQRVYLNGSFGLALFMISVIAFAGRQYAACISGVFVCASLVLSVFQFDRYNRTYDEVDRRMIQAFSEIGSFVPSGVVHIVNYAGYLSAAWDLGISTNKVLTVLYPKVAGVVTCNGWIQELQPERPFGPGGTCSQENGQWFASAPDGTRQNFGPTAIIHADWSVEMVPPQSPLEPLSDKRLGLLGVNSPAYFQLFKKEISDTSARCRMDSDWGYGVPCRLFGFYPAQAIRRGARMVSVATPMSQTFGWIVDKLPLSSRVKITIDLASRPVTSMEDVSVDLNGETLVFSVQERALTASLINPSPGQGGVLRLVVKQAAQLPQFAVTSMSVQAE